MLDSTQSQQPKDWTIETSAAGKTFGANADTISGGKETGRVAISGTDDRIKIAAKSIEGGPIKSLGDVVNRFTDKLLYFKVSDNTAVNIGSLKRIGISRADVLKASLPFGNQENLRDLIQTKANETADRLNHFDSVKTEMEKTYGDNLRTENQATLKSTGLTPKTLEKVAWLGTSINESGGIVKMGQQRILVQKVAGDNFSLNMVAVHDVKFLGKGTFGEAYGLTHLNTATTTAAKVAKVGFERPEVSFVLDYNHLKKISDDFATATKNDVKHEAQLLNGIHDAIDEAGGSHIGIQVRPHFTFSITDLSALKNNIQLGHLTELVGYVTACYNKGSLDKAVKDMNLQQKQDGCRQLFQGLATLHKQNITLGDIKPANVLVRSDPNDNSKLEVHLSDLGGAVKHVGQGRQVGTHTSAYLPATDARAVNGSSKKPGGNTVYHQKADVYALGATVYQTLTGKHPFQFEGSGRPIVQPLTDLQIAALIDQFPGAPEYRVREFFNGVLNPDPELRWDAAEASEAYQRLLNPQP